MMDCKPPTKRLGDATNTGFVCRWNRPEARNPKAIAAEVPFPGK
jgi:hypothetical protein